MTMHVDVHRIRAEASRRGYMTDEDVRLLTAYMSEPAPPQDVPPSLRFLQSPEAMEDGRRFGEEMRSLSLYGGRAEAFVEREIVSRMGERWPHVAAADRALGGVISEVVRKAARLRGDLPGWHRVAHGIAIGHPQVVGDTARELLSRPEPRPGHASYAEEAPDAYAMQASGNKADRDGPAKPERNPLPELEMAPFSPDAPVLETADDIPF